MARRFTRLFVATLPIFGETALLIVSELVANAVQHGSEPIALRLCWDGRTLRVEVSDGDSCVECVKPTPHSSDEHGRGLALTDHLALSWGAHARPNGKGKTVWATIA
jgi:anti-sigma regulatory factor (Ser/Thr protein kinase)